MLDASGDRTFRERMSLGRKRTVVPVCSFSMTWIKWGGHPCRLKPHTGICSQGNHKPWQNPEGGRVRLSCQASFVPPAALPRNSRGWHEFDVPDEAILEIVYSDGQRPTDVSSDKSRENLIICVQQYEGPILEGLPSPRYLRQKISTPGKETGNTRSVYNC